MRFSLLLALGAALAGVTFVAPASARSATFTEVALSVNVSGSTVTATTTVKASRNTTVQRLGICARDAANTNVDFQPLAQNVQITTSGTSLTRTRSYTAGTYNYFPCVQGGNGAWTNLPAKQFTVGAPPPPPPPPSDCTGTVFCDMFDGPSGAPADPTKWYVMTDAFGHPTSAANVFQDGQGSLVLRISRNGTGYLGGFLGTFVWHYNPGPWPPSEIKADFPIPYHIEMRAKLPPTQGAWTALWPMSTDRSDAQGVYELDVAEERTTLPTTAVSYQHTWLNGVDTTSTTWGVLDVSDMTRNWHVYSADVTASGVTYKVDGVTALTTYGVSGRFGVLLDAVLGPPGSWGSGGAQPAASDPGPWDMLVDYVKVQPL